MSGQIELNEETKERLEKFIEDKNERLIKENRFLLLDPSDLDSVVNYLLSEIERIKDECDLDREVLFDACLIGMQRAKTEDFDMSVSTLKKELFENIRLGAIWTGNNALLPQRYDNGKKYDVWKICDRVKEHNKARRYNHPVFKKFDKWRR